MHTGRAATEVKFARLPDAQALLAKLKREPVGIGRRRERLGSQHAGGLMMSMLACTRGRVHREHNFGTEQADKAHESFQRGILPPFLQGGRDALGIGPIELVQKIAVTDTQLGQAISQFGLAQRAQRRAALAAHHIPASFAACAINVGHDRFLCARVRRQGGRHARFIIRMREHTHHIRLQQRRPLFRRRVGLLPCSRRIGNPTRHESRQGHKQCDGP